MGENETMSSLDTDRPAEHAPVPKAALTGPMLTHQDQEGADGPDDLTALRQVAAGKLSWFDWFVDRYKARLLDYLGSRVRDYHVAEDLVQETFLRVFVAARRRTFGDRSRCLAGWLFTIAERCLIDHSRARARRPTLVPAAGNLADAVDLAASPAEALARFEQRQRLYALLERLPTAQAQVVRLKALADLSFPEIARLTQTPLAAVKSRMRYGLLKMHRIAVDQGDTVP